jgi:crotonobetainyl-CoA:carnitine CoA-transferase CaiB-like acyl-CoA transferase
MTDKFWKILCDVIARPALPQDPRFASAQGRRENRQMLTHILDEGLRKHPTEHWLAALTGKIPVAPVYDLAQALDAPFTRQAGMVCSIAHPMRPGLRVLANPLKIDGVRPEQRACSALGADNDAILAQERAPA